MLEPLMLTVPQLAARWRLSTGQIFEYAMQFYFTSHFSFAGRIADVTKEDRDRVPPVNDNDIAALDAEWQKREKRLYRGHLRLGPGTLDEFYRLGEVAHPRIAYLLEGAFTRETRDGLDYLCGPEVFLVRDGIHEWKEWLTEDDVFISMKEVTIIESSAKSNHTPAPASEAGKLATEAGGAVMAQSVGVGGIEACAPQLLLSWQDEARLEADKIHLAAQRSNYEQTNQQISVKVAEALRHRGIKSERGALTAPNILRVALQGGRWTRPAAGESGESGEG
jgi:hypothetical protein